MKEKLYRASDIIRAIDKHTKDTPHGLVLDKDITIILEEMKSVEPDASVCWGCNCPKMEMLEAQAETHDKRTETHGVCLDTISRNAAIDAFKKELSAKYNRREFAIGFVGIKSILENLPSARPEKTQLSEEDATKDTTSDYIDRQAVRMSKKLYDEDLSDYERGWNDACDAIADGAPSAQPDIDEWCTDCKEYDSERHCCPRYNRVIREAVEEAKKDRINCAHCKRYDRHGHRCKWWNHGVTTTDWCSRAERREDGRVY